MVSTGAARDIVCMPKPSPGHAPAQRVQAKGAAYHPPTAAVKELAALRIARDASGYVPCGQAATHVSVDTPLLAARKTLHVAQLRLPDASRRQSIGQAVKERKRVVHVVHHARAAAQLLGHCANCVPV